MANVGTLTVNLEANMANLQAGLNQAAGAIGGFERQINGITGAVTGFLSKIPLIGGALGGAFVVGDIFEKFEAGERSVAKLDAVLKAAGQSATGASRQLQEFASAFSKSTRFSGGDVRQAETVLTSMGLDPATTQEAIRTAGDLATVMGDDLPEAAKKIARALQDPADGLLRLSREGVHFTAAQKDLIAHLDSVGEHAKAQSVILEQLHKQYGGAAAADNATLGGQLAQAAKAIAGIPRDAFRAIEHSVQVIAVGGEAAYEAMERSQRAAEAIAAANAKAAAAVDAHRAAVDKLADSFVAAAKARAEQDAKLVGGHPGTLGQVRQDIEATVTQLHALEKQFPDIIGKTFGIIGAPLMALGKLADVGGSLNQQRKSESLAAANQMGEDYFSRRHQMESFAETLKHATETPLEKFKETAGQIKLGLADNLIPPDIANRGMRAAYEELAKSQAELNKPIHFGALEEGTSAAYVAAKENSETRKDSPILIEARKTVDQLEKLGAAVSSLPADIARLLPAGLVIP